MLKMFFENKAISSPICDWKMKGFWFDFFV